jgi:ubiquinone/menaquinone biosynthesis C-methylase UbiE
VASSDQTGSYRIGEERFRDIASELERLRIQADLVWPDELRALVRHGLREDADLLEVGCGPGFVTARLLEHVQQGFVTAIDIDSAMLGHARERIGDSTRVRFVEASATKTGLPDDAFDAVVVRLVLQHLPDVDAALAELGRVLRPGGRLIAVDTDHAFDTLFDPEPAFYCDLMAAVAEAQRSRGGDRYIGRRLPALLRGAGFSEILIDSVVAHSVIVGREPIRRTIPDQALDHLEASGFISAELATTARGYLAAVDAGELEFEGMVSLLVVSGAA